MQLRTRSSYVRLITFSRCDKSNHKISIRIDIFVLYLDNFVFNCVFLSLNVKRNLVDLFHLNFNCCDACCVLYIYRELQRTYLSVQCNHDI